MTLWRVELADVSDARSADGARRAVGRRNRLARGLRRARDVSRDAWRSSRAPGRGPRDRHRRGSRRVSQALAAAPSAGRVRGARQPRLGRRREPRAGAGSNATHPDVRLRAAAQSRRRTRPRTSRPCWPDACERRPRVALASGKLLRPGGAVLDSAGIHLPRHRRPRDRGSDEPDGVATTAPSSCSACRGAAMRMRRSALADLAIDGRSSTRTSSPTRTTPICAGARTCSAGTCSTSRPRVGDPSARLAARAAQRDRRRSCGATRSRTTICRSSRTSAAPTCSGICRGSRTWEVLRLGFAVLRDPADPAGLSRRAGARRRARSASAARCMRGRVGVRASPRWMAAPLHRSSRRSR